MAKDRRSKDQKRKAKLVKRTQKAREREYLTPYEGSKYRTGLWVPFIFTTEHAVYETIRLSERFLTNDTVKQVFLELLESIHQGESQVLPEDAAPPVYERGKDAEFLRWAIRNAWTRYFAENGPVSNSDLTGVLRTLLNSLEIHQWRRGSARGYVAFLWEFIGQMNRGMSAEAVLDTYQRADEEAGVTGQAEEGDNDSDEDGGDSAPAAK